MLDLANVKMSAVKEVNKCNMKIKPCPADM